MQNNVLLEQSSMKTYSSTPQKIHQDFVKGHNWPEAQDGERGHDYFCSLRHSHLTARGNFHMKLG